MRAGWVAGAALVLVCGCASDRAGAKGFAAGGSGEAGGVPGQGQGGFESPGGRYVDAAHGFEITRPGPDWQLDITSDEGTDGIVIPVVLRHTGNGAQVVVQVAPAVASPFQFAEKLTEGMRANPGFVTSDPEPLPLSEDAVGFDFAMGDRVLGRVAVRMGSEGRVLMLLGTWPSTAPAEVAGAVDEAFRRVLPIGAAPMQSVAGEAPAEPPAHKARVPRPNEI